MFKKLVNIIYKSYLYILYKIFGGVKYARKIGVTVGEDCRIFSDKFGSEPFLISLGNCVTVANGVVFITHDGSFTLLKDEKGRRYSFQKIKVGNNVFIGVNSIIMPGVIIEDDCIVAAGSIVTKSIPRGSIVGGVPARLITTFNAFSNKHLPNSISSEEVNILNLNYKDKILKSLDNNYKAFLDV